MVQMIDCSKRTAKEGHKNQQKNAGKVADQIAHASSIHSQGMGNLGLGVGFVVKPPSRLVQHSVKDVVADAVRQPLTG